MFRLYHTNKIDTATFSGGSWQPNLPLSNLYSPSTTKRARSIDAQAVNTQFNVALAEPVVARGIQIIATNLSAAAQYRITWYSDAAMTLQVGTTGLVPVGSSIDWSDTSEWMEWEDLNFWLGATPVVDPDNQGTDIRHNLSTPTQMQYIKIEFIDPTNAQGFVEIGYLFIGDVYTALFNVAPDPTYSRVSLTSMAQAIGGSQYFNRRGSRKRLVVTWPVLPKSDVLGEIDEIIRIHDIDRPVYVDLFDDSVEDFAFVTAFLARIAELPESKLLDAYLENDSGATIGFEFTQVL